MPALAVPIPMFFSKLFLIAFSYLIVQFLMRFTVWFKKAYLWISSIGQDPTSINPSGVCILARIAAESESLSF